MAVTAAAGSAQPELAQQLVAAAGRADEWLAAEFAKQPPPFYASVDIRASEHKIAPVDVNLFPGGFNNLDDAALALGAEQAHTQLERIAPQGSRLLVVAESHTRNPHYTDHLAALGRMLEMAGAEVRFASLAQEPAELAGTAASVQTAVLERSGDRLAAGGFEPDAILLNNDLSAGTPAILSGAIQPQLPPLAAGWSLRRKSAYFFQYERVAARFAREIGIDSWLLDAYFNVCTRVDVSRSVGLDCLAAAVAETLADISANYAAVGAKDEPFVVIKADAGTYGMGVVMLDAAEQVHSLNRKQRNSLTRIKDGMAVSDILIQEGIPSAEQCEGAPAEEVFYCVGADVVGSFWRLNDRKSARANLNSAGMRFAPAADGASDPRRKAAAIVARLALLAAAREFAGDLAAAGGNKEQKQ